MPAEKYAYEPRVSVGFFAEKKANIGMSLDLSGFKNLTGLEKHLNFEPITYRPF